MTSRERKTAGALCAAVSAALLMGAANGAWLQRVSSADHAKVNPVGGPAEFESSSEAGSHLFYNECAKCHGNDGMGKNGRPPVISQRVAGASDGDLFWLMSNGVPWRGMPGWSTMPTKQRWQLVSYLRALNGGGAGQSSSGQGVTEKSANEKDAVVTASKGKR